MLLFPACVYTNEIILPVLKKDRPVLLQGGLGYSINRLL